MKRKIVFNREVFYNKTIHLQTRLCNSAHRISYFSLILWVKHLSLSWHICSSDHINELFCETPKHCLTLYCSLEIICYIKPWRSYTTCFSMTPVTFAGVAYFLLEYFSHLNKRTFIVLLLLQSSEMLDCEKAHSTHVPWYCRTNSQVPADWQGNIFPKSHCTLETIITVSQIIPL